MRLRSAAAVVLLGLAAAPFWARSVRAQQDTRQALLAAPPIEHYLEALRQQAGIPGMSAAVVQDGTVVWERGFGFANVEQRIRATPDTPYYAGGLSQTLAAVLLLQCVEQRRLELDDPVRRFGLSLPEENATLRHVLTHTSTGQPGGAYSFAPERYGQLGTAMEWCAPQPYRKTVAHRILEFLAMRDSVPGTDLRTPAVVPEGLFTEAALERYASVLERMAVPYKAEGRGRATRSELPAVEGITAVSGLVTTVRDLAQFDIALDSTLLLLDDTRARAWSPTTTTNGTPLPTGIGWYVQQYRGQTVVWQYGQYPDAYSSMIIKLPARRVTLILLANSDGLAASFDLASGDVTKSIFATLFLRLFV
jgi:CubicO group peptidase (beta-lactamase class C family)